MGLEVWSLLLQIKFRLGLMNESQKNQLIHIVVRYSSILEMSNQMMVDLSIGKKMLRKSRELLKSLI